MDAIIDTISNLSAFFAAFDDIFNGITDIVIGVSNASSLSSAPAETA